MKTYVTVVLIFLAFLIVAGGVLGWDLTSFDTASSQFSKFCSTVNAIGTKTLEAVTAALGLPSYIEDTFTPNESGLPRAYLLWTKDHEFRDFTEFSFYYQNAYKLAYGTLDGYDDYKPLRFETMIEVYHYDLRLIIENDDADAYRRALSDDAIIIGGWFRWWFQRDAVKEEFSKILDECSHEHNLDTYTAIILKYEYGQ